jgi:hypothetical protein
MRTLPVSHDIAPYVARLMWDGTLVLLDSRELLEPGLHGAWVAPPAPPRRGHVLRRHRSNVGGDGLVRAGQPQCEYAGHPDAADQRGV